MRILFSVLCCLVCCNANAEERRLGHGFNRLGRLGLEQVAKAPTGALSKSIKVTPTKALIQLSESKSAQRFRKRLKKLLRKKPLGRVSLGIVVAEAKSGQAWVRLNADRLLNPASTMKLFTSAIALDRLGANHRFETELLVHNDSLYLRGNGDPSLTVDGLKRLRRKIERGRSFKGLFVDPFAFRGGVLPPGYSAKKTNACYRAAVGAVAINYGCGVISVYPTKEGKKARVQIDPQGFFHKIDNRTRSVSGKGSTVVIKSNARGLRTELKVVGRIGRKRRNGVHFRHRVTHPPMATLNAFRRLLKSRKITFQQQPKMARTPSNSKRIAALKSPPLSELIRTMNKESNNFIAEMLLRGMVQPKKGPATWKAGLSLARAWIKEKLGFSNASFEYNNGSGLYNGGRFSAGQVVALLVHMEHHAERLSYRTSLAIAGRDGTLINRLRGDNYAGRMVGKTGTLNTVSALSGYALTRRGRRLAFSILMNNTGGATQTMRRIQDEVVALIIESQ
jgi:D-alanyl-D-alanine carboxypeptidase/D-alanyl-D-alanine-endopeptidase (penicillin-binding protein 4)